MNDQSKIKLGKIISELLDQPQQGQDTQTQGNHPGTDTRQSQNQADATEQMSQQDQKKLADLSTKQAQFNDTVRKIDGEAQKLQEPVRRKMQDLQRKKAKAQQGLGSTTTQITNLKKKYDIQEQSRTMKRSELKELIKEVLQSEGTFWNRKKTYTPEEIAAVIFNEKGYQGRRLMKWLTDLVTQNGNDYIGSTEFVTQDLSRLGFSTPQIGDIRTILATVTKPIADYMDKRYKQRNPEDSTFQTSRDFGFFSNAGDFSGESTKKFTEYAKRLFVQRLSKRQDLLTPEQSPKNAYLEEGKKGLSGMKKSKDKKENTQMKPSDKTLTKTTVPKEKAEKKKLPVVKKPAQPKLIKEMILKMVREALSESISEMAKVPVSYDGKKLTGSVSNSIRKADPSSPTGYSHKTKDGKVVKAGTPVDAPSNSGKNYVKKTAPAADAPKMGRPGKEKSTTLTVNVNGKSIDQFSFKLPNGKDDPRPLKTMVDKFFYSEKNPELSAYGLDPSVYAKFEEMADLYIDDALPDNAIIDLFVKSNGSDQVLVAK